MEWNSDQLIDLTGSKTPSMPAGLNKLSKSDTNNKLNFDIFSKQHKSIPSEIKNGDDQTTSNVSVTTINNSSLQTPLPPTGLSSSISEQSQEQSTKKQMNRKQIMLQV
jgi:hypothetical protein